MDYDKILLNFKSTIKKYKEQEKRGKGKEHEQHLRKREKELDEKRILTVNDERMIKKLKYGDFGKEYCD